MRLADEGKEMVLADRIQRDVPDHDHLVEVGAFDDGHHVGSVHVDPGEDLLVHAGDPRWRLAQTRALRILADAVEEQPDALFDLRLIEALAGHARMLQALRPPASSTGRRRCPRRVAGWLRS